MAHLCSRLSPSGGFPFQQLAETSQPKLLVLLALCVLLAGKLPILWLRRVDTNRILVCQLRPRQQRDFRPAHCSVHGGTRPARTSTQLKVAEALRKCPRRGQRVDTVSAGTVVDTVARSRICGRWLL